MRDYGTAIETQIASLSGVMVRSLVWIAAKNRDTGETENAGFWNGLDELTITIGGVSRTYTGAGALLSLSPITGTIGLQVRMHQISLSGIPPEVLELVHGYDARLAPIEVHQIHYDPVKGVVIGDPVRILKGWIDEMPVPRPQEGGTATIDLTVASAARALTQTLTTKKSDEMQRRISSTDKGREYSSISGAVGVFWNVLNKRAAPPATTPANVNPSVNSGFR